MRSIALLAGLLLAAARAEAAPNVLLLMADQFRADALDHARTPNLDRLAREGCRFERAYSSTPSCTPARAALLTGMSPWGHGMLGYFRVAARYEVEFPRAFAAAGYRTHAIGKNHFYPQRNPHGYQEVELDESGRVESKGFVSDYRQWFRRVAPTLLDAAGLPAPAAVEGMSLLRLVRGETGWREVLDLEHATTYWPGNVWTALTDGRYKYVFHAFDGREQLFDIDTDPGETDDLAAREPERLAEWRARMARHLAPRGEPWVVDGRPGIRKKTILVGPNYPQ